MNYFDKDQVTGYVQGLKDSMSEVQNKTDAINQKVDAEMDALIKRVKEAGKEENLTESNLRECRWTFEEPYEDKLLLLEELRNTMLKTLLAATDYLEGN